MKIVVFSGGTGSRLWPMSRKKNPKQFQLLIGKRSIFQQTLDRLKKGFKTNDIFISTGAEYKKIIKEQAPEIPEENLILEPSRRDTMGAVGLATAYINHKFPKSIMAAIWGSDHLVEDEKAYIRAIKLAEKIASEENKICKIDARPTFPSTYNGWVEIGKHLRKVNGHDVYEFVRFVEKPDEATAKKMFRSIKYLINTGYLVWQTDKMLSLFKKHQKETYDRLQVIMEVTGKKNASSILKREYNKIPKTSADYGIFEKLNKKDVVVIPTDMGWVDIGTWGLLYAGLAKTTGENITQGKVKIIESKGNLVWSTQNKTIALVGMKNVVVVDSGDSVLVCNRRKTGDVKKLVEQLKKEKSKLT